MSTSKITTDLAQDDPIDLGAQYKFDLPDRRYLDNQARGCQKHLLDSLLDGIVAPWLRLDPSGPGGSKGDVVCLASSSTGANVVKLATAENLANGKAAVGIQLVNGVAGQRVRVAVGGVIPPSVTGLAGGAPGYARINTTTGAVERVDGYTTGDYPIGAIDNAGNLTLLTGMQPIQAGGGAITGADVSLDDSAFAGNLVGVTDVQTFADTFDAFSAGGTPAAADVTVDDAAFTGILTGVTDAQSAFAIVDAIPWSPVTGFTATPASASTITMTADHTSWIHPGDAVRIMVGTQIFDDVGDTAYSASAITGVTAALLEKNGCLLLTNVDAGAGEYYTKVETLSEDGSNGKTLLAHTANYSSNGAKNLIADGDSGLGGTVTVATYNAEENGRVWFYVWYRVAEIASNLLTLQGPTLTGLGDVQAIWRAPSGSHLVPALWNIPGTFAESTEAAALWARGKIPGKWHHSNAHLVRYSVVSKVANAGAKPKVNVNSIDTSNSGAGIEVTATMTHASTTLDPRDTMILMDDTIELNVTAGDTGDEDLSVWTLWVIE